MGQVAMSALGSSRACSPQPTVHCMSQCPAIVRTANVLSARSLPYPLVISPFTAGGGGSRGGRWVVWDPPHPPVVRSCLQEPWAISSWRKDCGAVRQGHTVPSRGNRRMPSWQRHLRGLARLRNHPHATRARTHTCEAPTERQKQLCRCQTAQQN